MKGYYCDCKNCGHAIDEPMDYCPKCSSRLPKIDLAISDFTHGDDKPAPLNPEGWK